ncbi:hypothetical protein N7508_000721 [Penicillium antarcticum]|uniref:uncharacterized protein n=1 Tax=Penicillium antarcticum TaxID=416450 RepID=UPI0023A34FF6|nr:uncharacterized protein N7508_000721 [Penicillium antarcticum]KAJ5320438.1 hypothetical protein N7508_000721 [Penicillium antarcticum]
MESGIVSDNAHHRRTWYRSSFFNITIVSLCAFIAPGLWAAMNGLGGAGAADPTYINAANSVIFCLQVLMIGGAVTIGVHVHRKEKGHSSVETYLVFIAIQAIGPFVASLLSPPAKVQRSDYTPVVVILPSSLSKELKEMGNLLCRKEVLLIPDTGVILANFSLGFFLDWKRPSINTRAIVAFILIYAFELSLYSYAMVITKEYENRDTKPFFDWTDDGFGRAVCVYILMLVGFNLMYDYLYWLVGTINKIGGEVVRLSAVIRGIESAGQAISYGINSINQDRFPLSGAVAVNMSFFVVCIIPSWLVIRRIGVLNGVNVHSIIQDVVAEDP